MIIFRYLSREVFITASAVSVALLAIFMSGRFVKYLAEAAAGEMSGEILFSLILFRMPGFLELILPLGLFLGILLVYGRLYVESEMIVLSACGLSKRRLLVYTLFPASVVGALVASLSLYITPLGWLEFHKIWNDPKYFSGLGILVPGRFQHGEKSDTVTYAEQIDDEKGHLNFVFIATPLKEKKSMAVMLADSGKVYSESPRRRFIELNEGYRYEGLPGQLDFSVTSFANYGQLLKEETDEIKVRRSDAKTTEELLSNPSKANRATLFWRLSVPTTVPIITLIALALSETNHRRGRYVKLLPAVLIYVSYIVLLSGGRSMLEKQAVPVGMVYGLLHGGFLLLGVALLFGGDWWRKLRHKPAPSEVG